MTGPGGVDLHVHSTASDGILPPAEVVRRAAAASLSIIALTDHDTVAGAAEAESAGRQVGVEVIAGCEFSVRAWWGELHLLGYYLPLDNPELLAFLDEQRTRRASRAEDIVRALDRLGATVALESVQEEAGAAPVGRPHVARALVKAGVVGSVEEAFARFLADNGPAYVERPLPQLDAVTDLVRRVGGVTSAAHLKERGTRATLRRLKSVGVDAVEVRHPAHSPQVAEALAARAVRLGLLMTGGSDWHGTTSRPGAALGGTSIPADWVDALYALHARRCQP